jgi:hypothetical protein
VAPEGGEILNLSPIKGCVEGKSIDSGTYCTVNCDSREIAGIKREFKPTVEKLSCIMFDSGPELIPEPETVQCLESISPDP